MCDDVDVCLESLLAGNKPVFFMKRDQLTKNLRTLYENGIPIVEGKNLDELMKNFEHSVKNYRYQTFKAIYI